MPTFNDQQLKEQLIKEQQTKEQQISFQTLKVIIDINSLGIY